MKLAKIFNEGDTLIGFVVCNPCKSEVTLKEEITESYEMAEEVVEDLAKENRKIDFCEELDDQLKEFGMRFIPLKNVIEL